MKKKSNLIVESMYSKYAIPTGKNTRQTLKESISGWNEDEYTHFAFRCQDCPALVAGDNDEWICDEVEKLCSQVIECPEGLGILVDESLKEDYNSDIESEKEIQKYLDDHDLWGNVSVFNDVVSIEIDWGDWKHDHARCQDLMSNLGYVLTNKVVTEEDGSDTFSAIHTYEKLV